MDLLALSRTAWRITRTQPSLWLLHGLLFVAGLPTLLITTALGLWSAARELEATPLPDALGQQVTDLIGEPTALGWLVGLTLVVVFSIATQVLLAAIYRSAAHALQTGAALGLRVSLALGRTRFLRILVLSLTLGAALSILGLLPDLLSILNAPRPVRAALQPATVVFNIVGGVVFLLLILTVSLDDVRGREAPRRAWAVFRRGWVGFALILAFTVAWSLMVGLLAVPGIVIVVTAWILPGPSWIGPVASVGVGLVCGIPLWLLILGGAAYTNIFQALVYRSAAEA